MPCVARSATARIYGRPARATSGRKAQYRYYRAMAQRRHRVAVLGLPSVIPLEVGIAMEVFGRSAHYDPTVCTEGGMVETAGTGVTLTTSAGLESLRRADTVIVPGYEDIDATLSAAVLNALTRAHGRGARVVSICTGAFAVAAAGLLDGRPATTHWLWADELQRRHPLVEVLPNRLFVDDGDILTSAGMTTGIDLCLHLIRLDLGAAAAHSEARMLVAPPQRQGGQAQYVEQLRPEATGDHLGPLRDWMVENLTLPIDLDMLAAQANVSRRTLTRRFREETGVTPIAWLTDARIERARVLLETTTAPVEQIGRFTGLGAPASFRAAFHRRLGTSPMDYRSQFRHRPPVPLDP
jgi:transcriptional regulator GlxA family with amidase domain